MALEVRALFALFASLGHDALPRLVVYLLDKNRMLRTAALGVGVSRADSHSVAALIPCVTANVVAGSSCWEWPYWSCGARGDGAHPAHFSDALTTNHSWACFSTDLGAFWQGLLAVFPALEGLDRHQ